MRERFPDIDFDALWHRVDRVFDHTEHLSFWGTHHLAQEQLKRLYPEWEQYVKVMVEEVRCCSHIDDHAHYLICKSGHHRSVAFLEILAHRLWTLWPSCRLTVWHLDHTRREGRCKNMAAVDALSEDDYEDLFEFPVVNSARHPPQQLLTSVQLQAP